MTHELRKTSAASTAHACSGGQVEFLWSHSKPDVIRSKVRIDATVQEHEMDQQARESEEIRQNRTQPLTGKVWCRPADPAELVQVGRREE